MLKLIQRSTWNAWDYLLNDAGGQTLGEVAMSHTPEATNARLQMVAPEDAIAGTIRLSDGCYRIRFEILRRGFSNDLGWWLEAPDGAVVARVDQHSGDLSRSKHVLILPEPGTLTIANGHFSPLDVQLRLAHGAQALRIREPGWFSLKRTLHIEGEAWTPAIRCFYAVYVLQCKA